MNRPPLLSKAATAHIDGVWVGGRLTLTETHLLFGATGTYRRVAPDSDLLLHLSQVASVTVRAGVLTRIITVATDGGPPLEFRCYGADEAADVIRGAVAALAPPGAAPSPEAAAQ